MRVEALPAVTVPPSRKTGRSPASFSSEVSARGPLVGVDRDRLAAVRRGASTGDDLLGEAPRLARGDRALVAAQRERVLVLAGDPVALGDVLGRLAHRLGRVAARPSRVDQAPAERRVVHRLRPARAGRPRASPPPRARGSSTRRRRPGRGRPRRASERAGLVDRLQAEAQSRLTVAPGPRPAGPASSAAIRATSRLSSPAWLAAPR